MIRRKKWSSEFMAHQIAGSCRIGGMVVSHEEELQMKDIIAGRLDANELKAGLVAKFKEQNTLDRSKEFRK